jgi:hypothetical protein
MKKIRIEFAEDRRWRVLWTISAIFCMGVLANSAWMSYRVFQEKQEISQQIQKIRLQMSVKPAPVKSKPDARLTSGFKAASLLQFDLNRVFSTIENMTEPSTRLINMSFDASAGSLKLEYELDSVEVAVKLTEKLNAGYSLKPWQLESLSAIRSNNMKVVLDPVSKTIGVWSCYIRNI